MNPNSKFPNMLLVILYSLHLLCVACISVYTVSEKDALEQFRPLVQKILYRDYMKEDHFLIRWLRARDLNVPKAIFMLGKAIRWRKENKIDTILNETILTFPVIPYYDDGISYSGNPISTFNIRALDMRKWILAGKRADLVRFMDQALEIGESGSRYIGERFTPHRQIDVIWDFNGYNQRQHGCLACLWVFQEWLRHYENYYPQLIQNSLIVNAPRIIKPLLNALKPFLSPHSQKILKIFGQNRKEWSQELFKLVPRNQLRKGLGGTKPDHVPCAVQDFVCMCKIFVQSAGRGTNTTVTLSSGLRRLDADLC